MSEYRSIQAHNATYRPNECPSWLQEGVNYIGWLEGKEMQRKQTTRTAGPNNGIRIS